jgi:hypothetical protein
MFKIVDARTGATLHEIQVYRQPEVHPNHFVAYTSSGIYVSAQGFSPPPGLWKIDPSSGALTQVSSARGFWAIVDGTAAWGFDNETGTIVRRMDLSTGVATDVLKSPRAVSLAGFAGRGVVVFRSSDVQGSFETLIVNPDGSTVDVSVPSGLQGKFFNGFFQDGQAILISGHGFGLAAYDAAHGLRVLTTTPDNLDVLGRCVSE